jgi:phosphopentomutase
MLYGHRNDAQGYARALEEADGMIKELGEALHEGDVLAITADHGCDPTTSGTDHSREYVPLLVYGKKIKSGVFLGTRSSFLDLGRTTADLLGVETDLSGVSFGNQILM